MKNLLKIFAVFFAATLLMAGSYSSINLNEITTVQRNTLNQIYPLQTGQTTSYATGDDGYYQYGRLVNFTTLSSNNKFGNTNRFTSAVGDTAVYMTGNYVVDNATGLGWSLIIYNKFDNHGIDAWPQALTAVSTYSQVVNGITYSDWHIPNITEMLTIANFGASSNFYNYWPFSIAGIPQGGSYWLSSTTLSGITGDCMGIRTTNASTAVISAIAKVPHDGYWFCRKHF